MRHVTLVTRSGCHLCEAAVQALEHLGATYTPVDIDAPGHEELALFSDEVPVILDGRWQPGAKPRVLTRLTASSGAIKRALRSGLWARITGTG